jgi:YidC/Oxa1 family membrane protein insertase
MDNQRIILLAVFFMSGTLLWTQWQKQYAPPAAVVAAAPPGAATPSTPNAAAVPGASSTVASTAAVPASTAAVPAVAGNTTDSLAAAPSATVETDLFTAKVSAQGGVIYEIALKQHRDGADMAKPHLLFQNNKERFYQAQSGLTGLEGLPNHIATRYNLDQTAVKLADGQDSTQLKLVAETAQSKVTQVLTFKRGSYVIDVAYQVQNLGAAAISPTAYYQLMRDKITTSGVASTMGAATYIGPALFNEADKFKKIDYSEIDKLAKDSTFKINFQSKADNGWIGMVEQYFVSAWMPADKLNREYFVAKPLNTPYIAGLKIGLAPIAPGATGSVNVPLFAGPQEQDKLGAAARGLDLVVDYGIFHIIAAPMFWLLKFFHSLVNNWGWAIILLTIAIKAVFYPLNAAAGRSMGKMKLVAPKLKTLQEQYSNDRAKLNQAMMELYKKEKINPVGGCLPIVIQIPVFIALYWVLIAAVELRHAPWALWIKDLAWFQAKLQPPSPGMDPMQQKMLQYMPLVFSVMFVFFPAGLVLYWTVSNILQIAQQWHINRMLEKEQAAVIASKR